MGSGKNKRMYRIFKDRRTFIVALDHGIANGNINEIQDVEYILESVREIADAVILNRGLIKTLDDHILKHFEIFFKINGISAFYSNPYDLIQFSDVEEALSYDAVAISYEMYVGGPQEIRQLNEVGKIISLSEKYDIPVMLHIYPHGEKKDPQLIAHCLRMGWEIGADIVKTFYYKGIKQQISHTKVPIIAAGGPRFSTEEEVLSYVQDAVSEGVKGVAIGRNLWAWKERIRDMAVKIKKILNG